VFGIRPVWYKSKDLERIKDVYRGTTVFSFSGPICGCSVISCVVCEVSMASRLFEVVHGVIW
jgi:hypothetical protein